MAARLGEVLYVTCAIAAGLWFLTMMYAFSQKEGGSDYHTADEILTSGMRVHKIILPNVTCQIENLINLDQIGSTAKIIALPAKWKTESAPARVVALVEN